MMQLIIKNFRQEKRNEGIVYSAYTFFRKLANAVSGSMSSFALAIAGF